jgi:hypothetical protein
MRNLQVDGERLWASLMKLAQTARRPRAGWVCRLAASNLDGEARRRAALLGFFYHRNCIGIV